jgi:hypothetical protein
MKNAPIIASIVLMMGCTTLRPLEGSPDQLQQAILCGELLEPGDRVRIVTTDGSGHEFRVTQIDADAGLVIGEDDSVPVSQIRAVERRTLSVAKTAGAVYAALVIAGAAISDGDCPKQ